MKSTMVFFLFNAVDFTQTKVAVVVFVSVGINDSGLVPSAKSFGRNVQGFGGFRDAESRVGG